MMWVERVSACVRACVRECMSSERNKKNKQRKLKSRQIQNQVENELEEKDKTSKTGVALSVIRRGRGHQVLCAWRAWCHQRALLGPIGGSILGDPVACHAGQDLAVRVALLIIASSALTRRRASRASMALYNDH